MKNYKSEKPEMACKIFNCDLKHGNQCCFYCKEKERCKNPCENNPDKCKEFYIDRNGVG